MTSVFSLQRHVKHMLCSHKGFRERHTPLLFVACTRKAALLCGHLWSAHNSDGVGREGKACRTGCHRQAYQEACTSTVRQRLFCVSVYALQVLASPEAACAYGAYAERYPAGRLGSTDDIPVVMWSAPTGAHMSLA